MYVCTMFLYLCSLKEESEQTMCGESLEKKNSETALAVASLPNKFKTIDSYISVLISKSYLQ